MLHFEKDGRQGHLALNQETKQVSTGRGHRTVPITMLRLVDALGNNLDDVGVPSRLSLDKILAFMAEQGWVLVTPALAADTEEVA